MGHHYNTIVGEGKDRFEAQGNAIADFLNEEGHRHSVRDVSNAKMLKKIPPNHAVTTKEGQYDVVRSVPNHDAPKDQWLEVWEFELHTHA
jgi:hypothetical protein